MNRTNYEIGKNLLVEIFKHILYFRSMPSELLNNWNFYCKENQLESEKIIDFIEGNFNHPTKKVVISDEVGGFKLHPLNALKIFNEHGKIEVTPIAEYYQETIEAENDLEEWKAFLSGNSRIPWHFVRPFTPDEKNVISTYRVDRECPIVVKYAKLKVVEIPEHIEYDIKSGEDEKEWIAEKHRIWS